MRRPWPTGGSCAMEKNKWSIGESNKRGLNICYKQMENIFVKPETTNVSRATLNYCELVTMEEKFIFRISSYSVAVFG
jgi:hypothetical protein